MRQNFARFDIVGVGALNVDFIATTSVMQEDRSLAIEFNG